MESTANQSCIQVSNIWVKFTNIGSSAGLKTTLLACQLKTSRTKPSRLFFSILLALKLYRLVLMLHQVISEHFVWLDLGAVVAQLASVRLDPR